MGLRPDRLSRATVPAVCLKETNKMNVKLTPTEEKDFLRRGFTRRHLGQIAALAGIGASLPFYNEPALAQLSKIDNAPADAVMINANENPLGPSPEALEAVHKITAQGVRYLFGETDKLQALLAKQEGLKPDHVKIYPGSSAPLHQSVLAFTSPTKPYVTGDPGYEAGDRAAKFIGTQSLKVPLLKDFSHDVKGMAAASATPGLIYVCNPNNPTGTLTSRADLEWLVDNKPAGAIVMIDEAYTHIAPNGFFCTDMVAKGKDVVILRTFSKIYGMAGLRAGAALGRPDLIAKIDGFSRLDMMPITGVAGAMASLKSPTLIPERRKKIGAVREDVFNYFEKNKFKYVPSVSNCVMVDTGRKGEPYSNNPVMLALRKENVYIGRVWPAWPTYVRVTIGTQAEMDKFKAAFTKVMNA
jgi:histidinol-phosphate/aromatic aminotransferase/cobyric acid decarboxylase-like protein